MSGGWLNGGPAGDLKMSVPTAFTTSLLAWGMLAFPSGYAAANQTYAGQQSVRWGADYLLKTLIANSTGGNVSSIVYQVLVTSGAGIMQALCGRMHLIAACTCSLAQHQHGATQVGNYTIDQTYWGRPEDIPRTVSGYPTRPAFTAPATHAADLGGAIVAALAASSLVFQKSDPGYSNTLLSAAFDLYATVTDSASRGLCAPPCTCHLSIRSALGLRRAGMQVRRGRRIQGMRGAICEGLNGRGMHPSQRAAQRLRGGPVQRHDLLRLPALGGRLDVQGHRRRWLPGRRHHLLRRAPV